MPMQCILQPACVLGTVCRVLWGLPARGAALDTVTAILNDGARGCGVSVHALASCSLQNAAALHSVCNAEQLW